MYRVEQLQREYKKKLITADQAAAYVRNGMRIHFGTGCGAVVDIDKALAKECGRVIEMTCGLPIDYKEDTAWQNTPG